MSRARGLLLATALLSGLTGTVAPAQEPAPASAILTVDQERLFNESLWGKRIQAELEAASRALQAENRKIESALTAEEKELTDKRITTAPADFRALADEFDKRVTEIRAAQDGKARDLTARRDTERKTFLDAVLPLMGEMMTARGAVAILDSRAIFLSVRSVDATDAIVAAIDSKLGDGSVAP